MTRFSGKQPMLPRGSEPDSDTFTSALQEMIGYGCTSRFKRWITAMAIAACISVQAMDRWAALSQIESRNNDGAVGAAGEISRYQLRPELWSKYAWPDADWRKPEDALKVAQDLMKARCAEFEREYHRAPTDLEFYVLWNAPAQIERPSKVVCERASRFCNLVTDSKSNRVAKE